MIYLYFSALMYLNADFGGGEFFFADGKLAIEVSIISKSCSLRSLCMANLRYFMFVPRHPYEGRTLSFYGQDYNLTSGVHIEQVVHVSFAKTVYWSIKYILGNASILLCQICQISISVDCEAYMRPHGGI